jgi:tRNA1Val (adenine37-N6)-methyltransferase
MVYLYFFCIFNTVRIQLFRLVLLAVIFMSHSTFAFKQFVIQQDKCAMKVGTDAVLLGAWVNASQSKNILDIGTGTGVIAIMLAQKSNAVIDAVDIDESAYKQALENVSTCPWKERISVHHTPFQHFSIETQKKYDLIVSNPPYFVDSTKTPEESRTYARHTDMLEFEELLEGVMQLLTDDGKFYVILPAKEGEFFRDIAEMRELYLTKLMRVKPRLDKQEKRYLMKFEKERKSFSETSITIEYQEHHSYTDEYRELTKDYYLAF